jgi:hypothetical protein
MSKENALALLNDPVNGLSPEVAAVMAAAIEDAPVDDDGALALGILYGQRGAADLTVTSRRVRNIAINWFKVMQDLADVLAKSPNLPSASGHALLIGLALNALSVLVGATSIPLSPLSAEIVRYLWLQYPDVASVDEAVLRQAFATQATDVEMARQLGALAVLGIVRIENGNVVKRERFVLVA